LSDNSEFVDQAVSELVDCGCVHEVSFIPYMVNPLSVATNKSGKKRLILDLSVLNKFAKKQKFKFEDWKLTIQLFKEDSHSHNLLVLKRLDRQIPSCLTTRGHIL
jgi:hypothetical protein